MNKIIATAIITFASYSAHAAPIMIGNLTFDESQFVDEILSISGTGTPITFEVPGDGTFPLNGITPEVALTDTDINTGLFCNPAPCDIELLFTDNIMVNGLGDDLLLFEQGGVEGFSLTINGIMLAFPDSAATTDPTVVDADGALLNMFRADLSDFGVALNGTIDSLILNLTPTAFFGTSDPMALVALNSESVPEPSIIALFAVGLFGLGFARRRTHS
jgi:hypothetical protein